MLRWIIGAPLLLLLVLFALSNPQPVRLTIWPFDLALEAPLSLAVLLSMAVAFLIGALIAWLGTLAAIARARRAEEKVRLLDAQVNELKARLPPPA